MRKEPQAKEPQSKYESPETRMSLVCVTESKKTGVEPHGEEVSESYMN